jgi:hypothetical protein
VLTSRTARIALATAIVTSVATASAVGALTSRNAAHRLRLTAPGHAAVGTTAHLRVSDTWRQGDVRFTLCTDPPAVAPACRGLALRAGQRTVSVPVPVDSPGRWLVSLRTVAGEHVSQSIDAAHPGGALRLLATGDSEIQYIDTDLAAGLASHRVRVTSDARVGTGISKIAQLDWVRHAAVQSATVRPDITVMFIGANDGFALRSPHGAWVNCCSAAWIGLLAQRVGRMMGEYLRNGRGRVYWFTLPIARDATHAMLFRAVNRAYIAAAARYRDGVHLVRADLLFTPGGRFTQSIPYHGHEVSVRAPDGIHLDPAGAQIAAATVIADLRRDRITG